jgi:chromosomal replication initiator protein
MADPDGQAWTLILTNLRRNHPAMCRQWFEELDFLGVGGGVLRVRAHSPVHRDYLQRQCVESFNEAAQAVTGRLITVRFLGPEDAVEPDREALSFPARPAATRADTFDLSPTTNSVAHEATHNDRQTAPIDRTDALVINPDNAFDNFVIGPGNRLAHAAALAVADKPGRAYNPLFIHGGVGLGKSHLLQAICLQILRRDPHTVLYYTSCDGFKTQYFEAVQAGVMSEFRHKFRDVDVLVIDDIHFLARWEKSQEEFFHTFNALYQANKQIILSSDAAPEEIPHKEARLVSRFKQGMVASVQPPDFETRVAIVKKKAALRGMDLADDVAFHIATRIDTNIRELEGAITRIQMQAQVDGKKVPDLAIAKLAIGEISPKATGEPTIQSVISVVTDFFGVRLTDLQSKKRRDHTTVMHAIDTVEKRRATDQEFDSQVTTLDERVKKANG